MEDGRLTDGQGRTVDFKNAVIIMTSNAGARALLDSKPLGFATGEKQVNDGRKSAVLEEVKRIFRPEFLTVPAGSLPRSESSDPHRSSYPV